MDAFRTRLLQSQCWVHPATSVDTYLERMTKNVSDILDDLAPVRRTMKRIGAPNKDNGYPRKQSNLKENVVVSSENGDGRVVILITFCIDNLAVSQTNLSKNP